MTEFIFIRPYALLLFLPVLALFYFSLSKKIKQQNYISENILAVLTKHTPEKKIIKGPLLLLTFSGLAVIALAGPAIPQKTALAKSTLHTVVILAMDTSMYSDDLKPSRLTVTKSKLNTFLANNRNMNTALIAFAGSAHIISPFTDDISTLTHFINDLNPSIMPESGFNAFEPVQMAGSLITKLKPNSPHKILLITDQLTALQAEKIINYTKPLGLSVDIVYAGTANGSVVPKPDGGLLRTNNGQLVVAKLPLAVLTDTAKKLNGNLIDINKLDTINISGHINNNSSLKEVIVYKEISYFFIFPTLFLSLLFRRGYVFGIIALLYFPQNSYADNANGLAFYNSGKYEAAADAFQDPIWKGNAMYRAKNYSQAIKFYEQENTPIAHYNRGNALAYLGKYKEAIIAYNQALQMSPSLQKAKDNKSVLENWLMSQGQYADDQVIAHLKSKDANIEKALSFLKALPEDPGNLMQKRLQLQHKNKQN